MKGPAIFLAQFAGDEAPFNNLASMAQWAAGLGYKGVQIPSWDGRLFDLSAAAESQDYCDEVAGICREAGVAAVGPWKVTTHGSVSRCSTVSSSSTAELSAETTHTHSSR